MILKKIRITYFIRSEFLIPTGLNLLKQNFIKVDTLNLSFKTTLLSRFVFHHKKIAWKTNGFMHFSLYLFVSVYFNR